jgi:hypothetical protein
MENLKIEDVDGDSFTLEESGGEAAVVMGAASVANISETDAHKVIAWLKACFGLSEQLEALAAVPELVIDVDNGTGRTRSVRWSGPDVPGELIRLAEIAITGAAPTAGELERRLREVSVRVDAGAGASFAGKLELAILRQLMATLGCERGADLPTRAGELLQELNNVRAVLAESQEKHRAALANVHAEWERKHASARSAYEREIQRKITERVRAEESIPARIEQALSREREVRAAVQADLDSARHQHREAIRQLRLAVEQAQAQEAMLVEVREALARAGVNVAPNLVASVQELARARDLNAGAGASYAGKLEKARELLHDMRFELCYGDDQDIPDHGPSGHVQYENGVVATWHRRITEALKASNPDA